MRNSPLVMVLCVVWLVTVFGPVSTVSGEGVDRPEELPQATKDAKADSSGIATVPGEAKKLWASSYLWAKAPELIVEEWLSEKPDTEGKYVLIEFWATWCPPCRRSLALLNEFHRKFGDELVVIGISHESKEDVLALKDHPIEFYSAIDTQSRTKKEFGVVGIPHVVILEPEGHVIWEGFPLLKDHELTGEIIERILEVGRKLKKNKKD